MSERKPWEGYPALIRDGVPAVRIKRDPSGRRVQPGDPVKIVGLPKLPGFVEDAVVDYIAEGPDVEDYVYVMTFVPARRKALAAKLAKVRQRRIEDDG